MLSLTKKTEYALIALNYLAERTTQTVSAREIADNYGMPAALVMNILKTLHHADMLSSTRGTKGGYRLVADLSKISIHELIGVLEGPVRLVECAVRTNKPRACRVGPAKCPIQGNVHGVHAHLVKMLLDVKVSDVVASPRQNAGALVGAGSR